MPISKARDIATSIGRAIVLDTISDAGELSGSASLTVYDSAGLLPSSADAGTQAYVTANQRLYIRGSGGWYNIAVVNNTPTISSVADANSGTSPFTLATDGTASVITITAIDSEGFPITYSATADSDFGGLASISQDSSVFTITPFSEDSATTTSGTVTFKASDGVNIASELTTFTLTFITENSQYTTLLAKASGNGGTNTSITDSSSNTHTVTLVGDTHATSFSPYRNGGYSVNFDGSDWLSMSANSGFDPGSGDFTIEAWINNNTSDTSNVKFIISNRTGGSGGWGFFSTAVSSNTYSVQFVGWSSGGTTRVNITASSTLDLGTWYHVAAVKSGSNWKIYVDGTEAVSGTQSGNFSAGIGLYIGEDSTNSSRRWNGYIRDVRIIKGTALYTSNFTAPTEKLTAVSGTELLACHLPYIGDGSTNNHSITISGDPSIEPFAPYDYGSYSASSHGGSVYFDGSGDRLSVAASTIFGFDGDFTVEFWLYYIGGNGYKFFWVNNSGSGDYIGYGLNNNSLNPWIWNDADVLTTNTAIVPNTWQHHAVVRNGTALTIYLDGKSIGSTTASTTFGSGSQPFYIGWNGGNDTQNTPGYFSDFKVVKGTAVYTSNFTPPTAPLSSTGASLHIKGTDANVYDASQTTGLKLAGDAASSTTQTKNASSSIYFDGTGDIVTADADVANFGTGDFTIEMWLRPAAFGKGLFRKTTSTSSASPPSVSVYIASGTLYVGVNSGSADGTWITVSNPFTLNTWSHFAITRNNGTVTVFEGGSSIVSATRTANVDNTTTFRIGEWRNSGEYFNGYIEDFRITKGLARYTSSFTPPTSQLLG